MPHNLTGEKIISRIPQNPVTLSMSRILRFAGNRTIANWARLERQRKAVGAHRCQDRFSGKDMNGVLQNFVNVSGEIQFNVRGEMSAWASTGVAPSRSSSISKFSRSLTSRASNNACFSAG